DPDGDPLIIPAAAGTSETVLTVGQTNPLLTPAPNFNGTATIPYTISDGKGGSASATVTTTVTPVDDAPVALDDSASTPEDVPLKIGRASCRGKAEGDPVIITGATATNGTAIIV